MDPAFRQPADLTDPAAVAAECAALADGMGQQAAAAASGSALGGHPNPGFYFNRVAHVLAAAAKLLAPAVPAPPPPGNTVPPGIPVQPAAKPDAGDAGAQPPGQQKQGKPK